MRLDGRMFVWGGNISLVIIAIIWFDLVRTPLQMIFGYAVAFATELLFNKYTEKNVNRSIWDRILTAGTIAAGLQLLIRAHPWWFYGAASFIGVSSKYLIRTEKMRHIFNPINFTLVFCLSVMPLSTFHVWADEYALTIYPIFHALFFGIAAAVLANRWRMSLSYIAMNIFLSWVLSQNYSEFLYWLGPEMGAGGMIISWLMITDPKTTPPGSWAQVIFGVCISVANYMLRANEILFSNFFALFLVSLGYVAIKTAAPIIKEKSLLSAFR